MWTYGIPAGEGQNKAWVPDSRGPDSGRSGSRLTPARKLVPDLATWLQCFAIYTAAITQDQPDRVGELWPIIAKSSQKYKWPPWVFYNATFRQKMAGAGDILACHVIVSLCGPKAAFHGLFLCLVGHVLDMSGGYDPTSGRSHIN